MSRFVSVLVLVLIALPCELTAQTPSPSATPAPTPAPAPTPTTATLINGMEAADLQQAIQLLKNNYINPEALNETELNRAMLAGVLMRLGRGATLLPEAPPAPSNGTSAYFAEVLDGHTGYIRPGALTAESLQKMDASLQDFGAKKVNAIVLDLRASPATNDFALAAEFAKRFIARGKPLFTLRKASGRGERVFTADREPAYQGMMIVLADSDTDRKSVV